MKSGKLKGLIYICVIICVVLITLTSPLFNVSVVKITGAEKLTESDIKKTVGLSDNTNFFAFSSYKAKKLLKKNNYVDSVQIKKTFPNEIAITLVERRVSGYIEFMKGTFLYIDGEGRVLEVATFFKDNLPIIVGLKFSEFAVGEILPISHETSFSNVVTIAGLLSKYKIENVVKVDVTNPSDIHLFIHNIDVSFGTISDADEKIRTIRAVLEKTPNAEDVKGFLDITDVTKPSRFRLLT